jgi:hypothetical protein
MRWFKFFSNSVHIWGGSPPYDFRPDIQVTRIRPRGPVATARGLASRSQPMLQLAGLPAGADCRPTGADLESEQRRSLPPPPALTPGPLRGRHSSGQRPGPGKPGRLRPCRPGWACGSQLRTRIRVTGAVAVTVAFAAATQAGKALPAAVGPPAPGGGRPAPSRVPRDYAMYTVITQCTL